MKTIKNNKAVKFFDSGCNQGSDYKYYCELKDEWCFATGKQAGCGSLFFNSIKDFKTANPILREVKK